MPKRFSFYNTVTQGVMEQGKNTNTTKVSTIPGQIPQLRMPQPADGPIWSHVVENSSEAH